MERFFNKELDLDSHVSQLKPGTVRERLNMRIVSNDDGSYAVDNVNGTKILLQLNPNYQPIGWRNMPGKMVVFSTIKGASASSGNLEIGTFVVDETTMVGTYTPIYNHQKLEASLDYNIECDNYEENDNIGRSYWTDRNRKLRAINVNSGIFTTYLLPSDLVFLPTPQQYMVLRGAVINGSGAFGPNQALGTVFTADGTEVYAGASVIEYVPVETLDISSTKTLHDIHFNRWISGGVQVGGWIYLAQLETNDGGTTPWSYMSQMIPLTKEIPGSGSAYQNYQGHESLIAAAPNYTSKGIQIKVDNIDVNYKRIRIAAVLVSGINPYGTAPAINDPIVIKDELITGATMLFDHIGNENLLELTLADINAIRVNLRAVGTLAIVQNFLAVGKVKSNVNYEIRNLNNVTAKNIEYKFTTDRSGYPVGADIVMASGPAPASIPPTGYIYQDSWYKVTGGKIIYEGVTYDSATSPDGEVFFQGVFNPPTGQNYTVPVQPTLPVVQAVIRIQKYTGKYKNIPITDDFYDYKGMAMAAEMGSTWRDETIRWGLMLYDDIGNPLFVQHMKDKKNIAQYHRATDIDPDTGQPWGFEGRLNETYDNTIASLRAIGTKFNGIDFTDLLTNLGLSNFADLKRYFSGFSIVRVPTERESIANGMLFPMSFLVGPLIAQVCGWTTMKGYADYNWASNGRAAFYYYFVSPDFQFNTNGLPNHKSGDYFKALTYYADDVTNGGDDCGAPELGGTFSARYYKLRNIHYPLPTRIPAPGETDEILFGKTFEWNSANGTNTPLPDIPQSSGIEFTSSTINNFGGNYRRGVLCRTTVVGLKADETGPAKQADPNQPGQNYPDGFGDYDDATGGSPRRLSVNWIRKRSNLYGGTTAAAKSNNEYVLSGHVQAFDDDFIAHITANGGIANDIEVFGGEAFINMYDVCHTVWDSLNASPFAFQSTVFFFCENAVNTDMREGRHIARNHSANIPGTPVVSNGIDYNNPEQFLYNPAYSFNKNAGVFPAIPLGYKFSNEQKHIVYYAGAKVDGERIDKMKEFLPNQFILLNGKDGAITNLRSKNNKLFVWQEDSLCYIPINERATVADSLGEPVTLGTGGVMARFDELQTFWGNQHQFGLFETEDSFMWFDAKRRSWCVASTGGQVIELSTVKGLQSVLANIRGPIIPSTTNIFPHYDKPANGIGVVGAFDNRFKEALISFKGITNEAGVPQPDMLFSWDNKNKQFAGSYSYSPGLMINFANRLISFNRPSFLSTIQSNTPYGQRSFVVQGNSIYVCYLAFVTPPVPIQPASDFAHWAYVGSINEVHVHNEGDTCKFYGVVYPNRIKFAINHDHFVDKVLDTVKMTGNDKLFDDATYETSDQIASDINLSVTAAKEYEYRNKSWYFNVPYPSGSGRLVDNYFLVTWEKYNTVGGNILVSSNELFRLVSAIFETRKVY